MYNFKFFTIVVFLCFFIPKADASIQISKQSISLFNGLDETTFEATNESDVPYLLSAKTRNLDKSNSKNFLVIPSVVRVEPGQKASFRIIPRDGYDALNNKPVYERFYLLTIRGIKNKETGKVEFDEPTISGKVNVQIAYDLALIYHGDKIEQQPWVKLAVKKLGVNKYKLVNESKSIIRFASIRKCEGSEDTINIAGNYLQPGQEVAFETKCDFLKATIINYGGFVEDELTLAVEQE